MSIPDVSKLQKMAVQSYEERGNDVEDWKLIDSTPTLKFYLKNMDLVIAIRGTADLRDTKADAMIAIGQLENSDRFTQDLAKVQSVLKQVNPEHVFGVGHSLGGAILDLLLHRGLIEKGVSYNPAVQPQDIPRTLQNRRIYMSSDPLYLLIGRLLMQKPEVRPSKTSIFTTLVQLSPVGNLLTANSYLKNHKLDQFEGGIKPETLAKLTKRLIAVIKKHNKGKINDDDFAEEIEDLNERYPTRQFETILSNLMREHAVFKAPTGPLPSLTEETESDLEGGRCPKCGLLKYKLV